MAVALSSVTVLISEAAYTLDYSFQGLTFPIFEEHHINLSQGPSLFQIFITTRAGLAGRPDIFLYSGPAPHSTQLRGPMGIRRFWDQSEDLQQISSTELF